MRFFQRNAHFATYAALAMLAAGCGSQSPGDTGTEPDAVSLDGDWVLVAATGLALDDAHPITLTVEGDHASGRSACNNYFGDVTISADTVSFGQLGGTEMACLPSSVMELEQAYWAALQLVETAALTGASLTLTGPDLTLDFEQVSEVPDAELTNTDWLLESVISGNDDDSSASSVMGEPATLTLTDDGNLSGTTGCRLFRSGYELTGDTVTVDGLATDKRGCSPEVADQDAHVLAALGTSFTVAIEGELLTVTAPSGQGLVYRQQ